MRIFDNKLYNKRGVHKYAVDEKRTKYIIFFANETSETVFSNQDLHTINKFVSSKFILSCGNKDLVLNFAKGMFINT